MLILSVENVARQNVLYNRKNLKSKTMEWTQLKFSGKLFVNEI